MKDPRIIVLNRTQEEYSKLLREEAQKIQNGILREGQVATDTLQVIAQVQQQPSLEGTLRLIWGDRLNRGRSNGVGAASLIARPHGFDRVVTRTAVLYRHASPTMAGWTP